MTTPSNFSETGISIYAEPPIWGGGVTYRISLNSTIEGYSHTIDANGGYKTATINLVMKQEDIEEWLENGLGRDIKVYNEGGVVVWEGFVNDMEASIGNLTVKRGPLMNIANRVLVVYSTVDTSVTPPAVGVRARTAYANDTASQARYGIIEKILSCGGSTDANAAYIRDAFIAENKMSETTPTQITPGGGGGLSLSLYCCGYEEWLKAFVYNTTATGTTTLSVRLQAVLTADPNGIISTDYSKITANTLSIPAWENDDPTALDYIHGLLTLGDTTYRRYTFGIYANRRAYYTPMPTTQAYTWRVAEGGEVYTPTNEIVRPWDVLPARWAHIPDFMIGRISNTAMRDDPRYMFIESLTYTAPYGLTLTGAKISKLPQILGQMGLLGLGV
jgi:hypothetical protein